VKPFEPTKRLQRVTQCSACPWRVHSDLQDIPNNYDAAKHRELWRTIAVPGDISSIGDGTALRVMACHNPPEAHCIGWLANQLGAGNNTPLRLMMRHYRHARALVLRGPQVEIFAETLLSRKAKRENSRARGT